jgi:hypothetical protein
MLAICADLRLISSSRTLSRRASSRVAACMGSLVLARNCAFHGSEYHLNCLLSVTVLVLNHTKGCLFLRHQNPFFIQPKQSWIIPGRLTSQVSRSSASCFSWIPHFSSASAWCWASALRSDAVTFWITYSMRSHQNTQIGRFHDHLCAVACAAAATTTWHAFQSKLDGSCVHT